MLLKKRRFFIFHHSDFSCLFCCLYCSLFCLFKESENPVEALGPRHSGFVSFKDSGPRTHPLWGVFFERQLQFWIFREGGPWFWSQLGLGIHGNFASSVPQTKGYKAWRNLGWVIKWTLCGPTQILWKMFSIKPQIFHRSCNIIFVWESFCESLHPVRKLHLEIYEKSTFLWWWLFTKHTKPLWHSSILVGSYESL